MILKFLISIFVLTIFPSAFPQQNILLKKPGNYQSVSLFADGLILSESYPSDTQISPSRWIDNRNILRDTYNAGKIFIDDFKYVYSAPARINVNSALWLAGITAVGGVIYAYDQEIYDALKRNKNHKLYKPIHKLGESTERLGFMGFTNRFYFASIALGYLFKYEPMVIIPAEILEGHFIEGAAKNVMNYGAGRHRPYENDGPYFFKLNEGSSFPSGHVAVVVQVADIVSYRIKFLPLSIAMYTIAGSICFQRITSEAHWPSDIYVAAVLGWFTSHAMLIRHDRLMSNFSISNVGNSPGLKYTFSF